MWSLILILFFALAPLPELLWGAPWYGLAALFAFIIFPILDHVLPRSKNLRSVPPPKPTFLLYFYLAYHPLLIILGARSAHALPIDGLSFWLSVFSVGVVTGGIGITFAHEWVHKLKRHQKLYGEWLLVWVGYGHYATEHVYGHHKHVGTMEDGATARKGEWIQAYIPRALIQVWLGAFRKKPTRTLLHGFTSLLIALGIGFFYDRSGVIFFFAQAFVAVTLLSSIDYIEHYGLERKRTPDGKVEAVKPKHSWDSDTALMGELLIHLQRHADHHMHPLKPYPELELLAEAPRLPTGYAGMIWLAWWPHLWFKIMNPRISQSSSHDGSRTTQSQTNPLES